MNNKQTNPHRIKQRQILHECYQMAGFDETTGETDNKRSTTMRVYIRCHFPQP